MAFVNNTSTLSWLPPNSTITSTSSISTNYPWDAGPWRSYFPEPFQSTTPYLDASQAIALSSFISYGREEACTSAYSAFEATVPWTTIFDTYPLPTSSTLPNGQITEFSYDYTLSYTEKLGGGGDFCCWACSLYYTNLQLRYWPVPSPNTGCLSGAGSSITFASSASSRFQDVASSEIYATGENGFIYTSPSIYVAFPEIRGTDGCGLVGPTITSLTLAFAPGEVSTVTNLNPGPIPGSTVVFNPADMPCGPDNGTNGFLPSWVNVSSYQPVIALPREKLIALRPDWARCTNDYWEGQDPPYALTPVAGGLASFSAPAPAWPVTSSSPFTMTTTPASPSSPIIAPPSSTAFDQSSPSAKSDPSHPEPPRSSSPILISPSTVSVDLLPTISVDSPPKGSSADPSDKGDPLGVVIEGQTLTNNGGPITLHGTPILYSSGVLHVGTDPQPVSSVQETQKPIIAGSLTFTPIPSLSPSDVATAKGEAVTPVTGSPGMVIFHGQTLAPSEGTTTVDGIPVFMSGGSIYISGQAAAIPTAPTAAQPKLVTLSAPIIDGQTLSVLDPSVVLLGSQTITLGQPPILISGSTVSLGSNGLVVGSSTIAVGAAPTPYIIVGSETIALASADIVVNGKTLTRGGPGITVDGTLISLGISELVIGTKTDIYEPDGSMSSSATGGIGALIISGFGAIGDSPTTTSGIGGSSTSYSYGTPFTGTAVKKSLQNPFLLAYGITISIGVILVLWL